MNKILIAVLATSFILGASDAKASENVETDLVINDESSNIDDKDISDSISEYKENIVSTYESADDLSDFNIIIEEIESSAPDKGADYVKIYNKGNEVVNLNNWYIWDNKDYTDYKTLGDIKLNPGQSYILEEDVDFTFGLGKNDSVRLYNSNSTLIDSYSWSAHAQGIFVRDISDSLDFYDTGLVSEDEPTPEDSQNNENLASNIVINEVESSSDEKIDYVEIYNKGDKEVSLDGYYLLDDKDDREISRLEGVTLKPGEFFVLEEGTHFDFGLGKEDKARLFDKEGNLVDEFSWSGHAFGAYSRYPDGLGEFVDAKASKASSNNMPEDNTIEEVDNTSLVINEVQQKALNDAADYVEIKNITDKDIDLSGWYILDDDLTRTPETIAEGTIIKAKGYYVLENGVHFSFGLGKNDQVNLFNPNGKLADSFSWNGHAEGKVYARDEKTGEFSISDPTPGRSNDSKSEEDLSKEKPIVINEIESSPTGGGKDYVEIYNRSDKPVDISGYYVLDNKAGISKTTKIGEGTILEPKSFYTFEQGVDFDFGLGSNDEVNLYDRDSNLLDKFSWSSHASGTYGRYPDGFGNFVDGSASKGRENILADDPTADVEVGNWPGSEDVTIIDKNKVFDLKDLSGLDTKDGWLYGVNNKEGRFIIFKVEDDKVVFADGFDEKGKAVNFIYDKENPSKLGLDSEGITVDNRGRVYLAAERDNNNKNVNYNTIIQVEDPYKNEKVLVADRQWDITGLLPDVGANLGIETVEWVDFKNLNGLLYDQKNNQPLDYNTYKDLYAGGIFFVGLEANGHIYALGLKEDGKAELIADIPSGLGGVMGLNYDVENNVLWALSDDGYNNIHTVIQFNGTDQPTIKHIKAPAQMDKKLNNEGIVIDSNIDENGNRSVYYFMDGVNTSAFRRASIKADYMKDLGLSKIEGKKISDGKNDPQPTSDGEIENPNIDLNSSKKLYQSLVDKLYNLKEREKADYNQQIDDATSLEEIISIYEKAKEKSYLRVRVPHVDLPAKNNDLIYVGTGYTFTEEGFYKKSKLIAKRQLLLKALEENRIISEASNYLLENTPETIRNIREKLLAQLHEARKLQKLAAEAIRELDKILN